MSRLVRTALGSVLISLLLSAGQARAAAEVHRFNLVLSMIPTSIDGGDFNNNIDFINTTRLTPLGLEGLKKVSFAWLFDAQFQYMIRTNMAVTVGVGQLRAKTDREYLPALDQAVQLHGEVLSVPVQVGGLYYLAPFNQGDFQARVYLGGGVMSLVYNRALFQQEAQNVPSVPSGTSIATHDGPGYYAELGGQMWFASHFSVMIGGIYRSAKIEHLVDAHTGAPVLNAQGKPYTLDFTGGGAKLGIVYGF